MPMSAEGSSTSLSDYAKVLKYLSDHLSEWPLFFNSASHSFLQKWLIYALSGSRQIVYKKQCSIRDAEVAGSNPVASIKKGPCRRRGPFLIDSIEREPATSAVTNIRDAEGSNVQWTFDRFKSCRIDVLKSRVSGFRKILVIYYSTTVTWPSDLNPIK